MTSAPFTLTSLDRNYLHMASARCPMHWSLLVEMAPSGDRLTAAALRDRVRSRARRYPMFGANLYERRFRGPRVEAAEDWDPGGNVVTAAVTDPIGLRRWVAANLEVPLPPTRPRWQVALVDVASTRCQYLVVSADHCIADGLASAGFAALVADEESDGLGQFERFLTTERFTMPSIDAATAKASIRGLGRTWIEGGLARRRRWPALSRASGRAVEYFSVPTSRLRELTRATDTTTLEYILAAVGVALGDVRARYAPRADRVRVTMPMTLDPALRHTGNAVGLAFLAVPLGEPRIDVQAAAARRRVARITATRSEFALPWLSGGERLVPWTIQRAVSRGFYRLLRPDVAVGVTPGYARTRSVLGQAVSRIYPFTPLAGYSAAVSVLTLGRETTFGIISDRFAVPGCETALATGLDRIIANHHAELSTHPLRPTG